MGNLHPAHRDPELRAAAHHIGGYDAVGDDPPGSVDVREEQVERLEPLMQSPFEKFPFCSRNHPRDDIDRDDTFLRAFFAVDGKGDSFVEERPFGPLLHNRDLVVRRFAEDFPQFAAMRARRTGGVEHFVVESGVRFVAGKELSSVRRPAGPPLFGRHRLTLVRYGSALSRGVSFCPQTPGRRRRPAARLPTA